MEGFNLPSNIHIENTEKFSALRITETTAKKSIETTDKAVASNDASATPSGDVPPVKLSKNQLKKLAKQKGKKKKMSKADKEAMWGSKGKEKKAKTKGAGAFSDNADAVSQTKVGEKKDLSIPMADKYNPVAVESAWNSWWEKEGFFKPKLDKNGKIGEKKDKFVMVIPPPNVTGTLHLGHALTTAIEDALSRWHRMNGKTVLWVPGTDHAGIATQVVVEKQLKKLENKTRHQLGREKFIERVWEWKEKHGGIITGQMRKMGTSVDWSREVFTMDPKLNRAVTEAFVRMFDMGLIYREQRLVNWCCELKTAISDIEVDVLDLEGKTLLPVPGHAGKYEFGVLCEFAYPVEDSDEELVVATTRLETMLGDTGVAIHPNDERYTHLHGKFVKHPFNNRRIPIVCDEVLVDMSFGTGAVKVTPAHDKKDFDTGKRHNLPMISIFTETGKINHHGGELFEGMMRFDARYAIEEKLTEMGLWRGKKDNKMQIPICSRTKDIVEPTLKPQWWVSTKVMAKRAADAVRNSELRIIPSFHKDTWFNWLDNIREWCISRQLWWGHRIPAYRVVFTKSKENVSTKEEWVVGRSEAEAMDRACDQFKVSKDDITLEQDEDVLDTWFSSGLFPFSVMGWPDKTPDLENFFPTSLLETGHDILFFWVARMVMMSLTLTDKLPFKDVYLHAMVRDKYGRKMSKSLGNVIDPLEVINGATLKQLHAKLTRGNLPVSEVKKAQSGQTADYPDGIPRCGADALRFGLLIYTVQGRDVNLDIQRVAGYRMFCNKLWQATRFALSNLGDDFKPVKDLERVILDDAHRSTRDEWILHQLNQCVAATNKAFTDYVFGDACTAIYNFLYYQLFGVYLESIKPVMYSTDEAAKTVARRCLWLCLDAGFRLLHPIMPFVTEELWQRLPGRECVYDVKEVPSVMLAPYPKALPEFEFAKSEASFEIVNNLVKSIRSLGASYNLNKMNQAFVKSSDPLVVDSVQRLSSDIGTLSKCKSVAVLSGDVPKTCGILVVDAKTEVMVSLEGLIDPKAEVIRLNKKIDDKQRFLDSYVKKTLIPNYETKVPEKIRLTTAEKIKSAKSELDGLIAAKKRFEAML